MINTSQASAILFLATLTLLVATSSGCFFRNCPRGGKRGLPDSSNNPAQRQCMSCMGTGVCVGPATCCGYDIGCHIGTEHSKVCAKENESVTPCKVPGKSCGSDGNCVADGICCDSETCTFDAACRRSETLKPELVELLKRLLASKRMSNDRR